MTAHPTNHRIPDPIPLWERDLRTEVVGDLSPAAVGVIVGAVAAGAIGTTVAAAAVAAAVEGGVTMTTTITASAASHVAIKAAALGLAAALAAGGTAAVTGNLPDGAQRFTADAAAHIGIALPRPDTSLSGSLDLEVGDVVNVAGAGRVGARLDGAALVLTGIETIGGFEASVVSQTSNAITVEFRSAAETATVVLTQVDGTIESTVDFAATAGAEAGAEADGGATTGAETGAEAETQAETQAEAEADLKIEIGG